MTPLEIAANIVNLVSVWLAARNSIHTWWSGIVGCILFAFLFFQVKLYADVTLQLFFIATSIYGWRLWMKGGSNQTALPIQHEGPKKILIYFLISILVTAAYGYLLHSLTDASYPFVDSFVLLTSIVAQLLLMRRKLETWYFWILVNVVSVPLYYSKALYLTAFIYFLFLLNSFIGLRKWKKEILL